MPKVISEEIKNQIRHLANNNYLRQGEIAKRFGVSKATVYRITDTRPRKRRETRKDAGVECPITGLKFF